MRALKYVQLLLWWFFWQGWTDVSQGAQFLGQDQGEEGEALQEPPKNRSAKRRSSLPGEEDDDGPSFFNPSGGRVRFIGNIGLGLSQFNAEAGLSFPLYGVYLSLDITGFYGYYSHGDGKKETIYGPHAMLSLKLQNPTPIIPLAAAGPGYNYWRRENSSGIFDKDRSLTWNYSLGIGIKMGRHFMLKVSSDWQRYVHAAPKAFDNPAEREQALQQKYAVGFLILL